jgi:4-alpha-glucanotransferase
MSKKAILSLALHSHQPVGNFEFVFEDAYRKAYSPLIGLIEKHPKVRMALHYSGPLRDWLAEKHPEFLQRVAALASRNQVEIMTGAYYEPVIAAIPDGDKLGQIRKLTAAVKSDFGCSATGMWLAERIWEPHLPLPMANAGVDYTIVDDTHFKYAGLEEKDLLGYYVTEEAGRTVKVFATSKQLRYLIPWKTVPEIIKYLQSEATEAGSALCIMGDDGEKFGSWPGTYEWCYEKGWMEAFFKAIEDNSNWLEMLTPGEYANRFPPLGRIYLPTASYGEMMEWALPADVAVEFTGIERQLEKEGRTDILRFLRGGFWRNFMVKYPEINNMHKKMLHVHDKVWHMQEGPEKEKAKDQLWMGQCNCPYWHGVFGGIYYTHIRTANYNHLIEAEKIADAGQFGESWVNSLVTDFDCDSLPEVLLESNKLNLYFDPQDGGMLFELDYRDKDLNMINTLSRRKEPYHKALVEDAARHKDGETESEGRPRSIHDEVRAKEEGLEKLLHYDWYRRTCLIDHFLHAGVTLDDFANATAGEAGDFANQPFRAELATTNEMAVQLALSRDGHVWVGGEFLPLRLVKKVRLKPDETGFAVDYEIINQSAHHMELTFAPESNFSLISPNAANDYYLINGEKPAEPAFNSMASADNVERVGMFSGLLGLRLELTWSKPATLWRFAVQTVQNSEGGLERSYQCSAIVPLWHLGLDPGQPWQVRISFQFQDTTPY